MLMSGANMIKIEDEEIWELVGLAVDSLTFVERLDGNSTFTLSRDARMKIALDICNRNLDKLPVRIRSRLSVE